MNAYIFLQAILFIVFYFSIVNSDVIITECQCSCCILTTQTTCESIQLNSIQLETNNCQTNNCIAACQQEYSNCQLNNGIINGTCYQSVH